MLVLSRHIDERVIINGDIIVTVVAIRGDKVRLGIEAPKEMSVHREEVYNAIKAQERIGAKVPDLNSKTEEEIRKL